MSPSGHIECGRGIDAAPYVLGALSDQEEYRAHLEDCESCRAEVAELQIAVDTLPEAVPQVAAPRELHERVLATVRSEAELLRAAGSEAKPAPGRPARWRSRRLSLAGSGLALGAAVAIVLVVVLGGGAGSAEDVRRGSVAGIPGATAALHLVDDRAELVVSGMPQPALGKIYEVWLKRGSSTVQPTDALFAVTSGGNGSVAVPGDLHGVSEVLVTSEPLGGSSRPTSAPLLRVALSA